jgi:hypothetical protein
MNAMVPMQAVEASELRMVEGGEGPFDIFKGLLSGLAVDNLNSAYKKEQQGGGTTNQGGTGNTNNSNNGSNGTIINFGCGCPHPA